MVARHPRRTSKTVECCIMDLADDIAYSTYDLEDAFKAGFLTPLKMISASRKLLERVASVVNERLAANYTEHPPFGPKDVGKVLLSIFGGIFDLSEHGITQEDPDAAEIPAARAMISSAAFRTSAELAGDGYLRTDLTSQLVGRFIRGVRVEANPIDPALTRVYLEMDTFQKVEVLKTFAYEALIMAPTLRVSEYRGRDIVQVIFDALAHGKGHLLMPDDFREVYDALYDPSEKMRVICDFVAGMTDRYALEFCGRLFSTTPESIWKPI